MCLACFEHLSNMCRTCVEHVSNMGRTWVEHGSNMCRTCVEHVSNMRRTRFAQFVSNMCRTCVEHVSNMCRTCVEHVSNMCRTCVEHSSIMSSASFIYLSRTLYHVANLCRTCFEHVSNRSRTEVEHVSNIESAHFSPCIVYPRCNAASTALHIAHIACCVVVVFDQLPQGPRATAVSIVCCCAGDAPSALPPCWQWSWGSRQCNFAEQVAKSGRWPGSTSTAKCEACPVGERDGQRCS